MNKKNKQLIPLCFVIAVVLFFGLIYTTVSSTFEEYKNTGTSGNVVDAQLNKAKSEFNDSVKQKKENETQMQSIKQVFETKENSDGENLGAFGTMFEDIIKLIQSNSLLIRSIEYDMRPAEDQIYLNYLDIYNVCELKFFLVGTYTQLKSLLKELTTTFPYLVSISRMNVTAFTGNTDYILINLSITLYSKKPRK